MTDVLGTPSYIAPEVLRESYTELCDIWGIGVVSYKCATNLFPFVGSDRAELFKAICTDEVIYIMDEQREGTIRRMLDRNLDTRPQAKAIMKTDVWLRKTGKPGGIQGSCGCLSGR